MENVQFFTPALLLQVKIFIIQHSVWCSYTGEGAHSTAFSLIYFFLFPVRGPDAAPAFVKDHTHLCQKLNSVPPTVAHSSGTAGTLKSNNWFQKGSRHAHTISSVCVCRHSTRTPHRDWVHGSHVAPRHFSNSGIEAHVFENSVHNSSPKNVLTACCGRGS